MGIKNLNKLLRNKCPNVFETIHISEYAFKKVAIDISLFLCKFKSICGTNWVSAFINLVSCLRRNEIHAVFIFDNGSPIEKTAEKEDRRKQQENMKKKIEDLELSMEKYHKTKVIEQNLLDLYNKLDMEEKAPKHKRLLGGVEKINISAVEEKILKMKNYILNISKEDFDLSKNLFDILNVPYYTAPLEAECMCADLCKRGLVDAVLTEDTDVLAYGTKVFLSKIDTTNDTCVSIKHEEVLESMNLNEDEFLDLCIMCGCDYNSNIPKIGVETSYKYIQKYRNIDEFEKQTGIDVSILNHVRTRELFKEYEKDSLISIPYCGEPDFELLKKFIMENKISINFEKIKKDFIHNVIVIEE